MNFSLSTLLANFNYTICIPYSHFRMSPKSYTTLQPLDVQANCSFDSISNACDSNVYTVENMYTNNTEPSTSVDSEFAASSLIDDLYYNGTVSRSYNASCATLPPLEVLSHLPSCSNDSISNAYDLNVYTMGKNLITILIQPHQLISMHL